MGDAPSEEKKENERLQILANESFVKFLVSETQITRICISVIHMMLYTIVVICMG